MSSTQPKPSFAKDYITSAQIASLGYLAKSGLLKPGMTGLDLKNAIKLDARASTVFTPTELDAFVQRYKFIKSTSPAGNYGENYGDRCVIPVIIPPLIF